jgi:hypothetical protein
VTAQHTVEKDAAHDMSRYWRLVINEHGLVTGTWWVTRADRRGEQHVRPIDVIMWSEGRHSGLMLHSEDFTAFVRDGEVEPISVRARHAHVEAEAKARLDEIAVAVRAVAAAPDWPEEPTTPPPGEGGAS